MDEFLNFALKETADWNSGPLAHDFCDFFFANFFLQHRMIFLQIGQAVLCGLQFFFRGGEFAIANLRNF